jgi:hypothetical protein
MPALAKAGLGIGERFEQNGTRHPASRTSPLTPTVRCQASPLRVLVS